MFADVMFRNILPMSVPSGFQIFIVRKNIGHISRGDLNPTEKKTNMDAVAVAGPDVPFLVDLDAIWYARIGIRKYTPVSKGLGSWVDIERVAEKVLVRKCLSELGGQLHRRGLRLVVAQRAAGCSSVQAIYFPCN